MSLANNARLELAAYFNSDEITRLKKYDRQWFIYFWLFFFMAVFLHGFIYFANTLKIKFPVKQPPPLTIEIVATKGGTPPEETKQKPVVKEKTITQEVKKPETIKKEALPKPTEKTLDKPLEPAKPEQTKPEKKEAEDKSAATIDADKYADYLKNPKPPYPMKAFREGVEGTVWLRVQVLEDGSVGSVELLKTSGSDELDESALTTVKKWRFNAAVQNGKVASQYVRIPITFQQQHR